jgi:hypothetical protein
MSSKPQRHGFMTVFEYMRPCRCESTMHHASGFPKKWWVADCALSDDCYFNLLTSNNTAHQ